MIYDFTVKDISGNDFSFDQTRGKVLLIVNTASKCGLAPQFAQLESLYQEFKEQDFMVIGFPSGQFMAQEYKDNSEIQEFCQKNYGVTFPMMDKIVVNGSDAHPLYKYLKSQQSGPLGKAIEWNFAKFLIDRDGNVVKRFSSKKEPNKFKEEIEALL